MPSFLSGARILVVDDDPKVSSVVVKTLQRRDAKVAKAESGEEALEIAGQSEFDLVISDVRMPGMDGLELMRHMKNLSDAEIIIMTAYADIALAVKAMREGAYDFLTKPFSHISQVIKSAERALEKKHMQHEIEDLQSKIIGVDRFEDLVGDSPSMQKVYRRIEQVAETESTVLIQGETGTGKELVAKAIHARSNRSSGPFVVINCGTLTEQLLESELFGHMKGAFTGALTTKLGLFEAATGGTIFLDEIDSTSQHTQVGLLRVLQEKEIRPVGAISVRKVNVRVIASTQRDLLKQTQEDNFREDLYYRLSAITLPLPPLREKIEDIPLLSEHFLRITCETASKKPRRLLPDALDLLRNHHWPGNVRELGNIMEQVVLFSDRPTIRASNLRQFLPNTKPDRVESGFETLKNLEREHILKALKVTQNSKVQSAKLLGIPRTTLYQKIKRHKISNDDIEEFIKSRKSG